MEGRLAQDERLLPGQAVELRRGQPKREQVQECEDQLRYEFVPLLKHSERPAIRCHDLRHIAATLLHLQEGVHPKVVQEMLGHATISITLDTYSRVLPNMHRDASIALEQALWG